MRIRSPMPVPARPGLASPVLASPVRRLGLGLGLTLALTACGDKDGGSAVDLGEDADGDGWPAEADCDDTDATVFPGADELCNERDDDCDETVDEDPADGETFYADVDGDGFGAADWTRVACSQPDGWVTDATDCDDLGPETHPGADELCDERDNDCDEAIDESPSDAPTWYVDEDGDGYGDPAVPIQACEAPGVYVRNGDDCDDGDATLSPATVWYGDVDGDGYGGTDFTAVGCEAPDLHVADSSDCDDYDAEISPDATEVCDEIDNDCDGTVDGETAEDAFLFYEDADADGYGLDDSTTLACSAPEGFAEAAGDCDDEDDAVSPGAPEDCSNGIDDNCDDIVDEYCGISLADADVTWDGEESGDYAGYHLSAGGDFDGDGQLDLAIGAYGHDASGTSSGRAYVLTDPLAGGGLDAAHASIVGTLANDYLGYSVRLVPDVTGDGYDDMVVGAWGIDIEGSSGAGAAYVVAGPDAEDISAVDAHAVVYGDSSLDYLGQYQTGGGEDLTGDGQGDLLVGMTGDDVPYSSGGALLLFAGPVSGELSPDVADARIQATGTAHYIGYRGVSGDVTGDGLPDLAYGASGALQAHVLEGPLSGTLDGDDATYTLDSTASDGLGSNVILADFDDDGHLDLAVGAKYDGDGGASAGAWFLMAGPLTGTETTDAAVAKISETAESRYFGAQNIQADAGDVDGDGRDDLLLGSPDAGPSLDDQGVAWLFLGPIEGSLTAPESEWSYQGESSDDAAGYGVELADLDDDGFDDVIVGARSWSGSTGRTYIVLGGGL